MNIEVGKFYQLRNGDKVRIYANDGITQHSIHGAYFCHVEKRWLPLSWHINGNYWSNDQNMPPSNLDIIGPWVEPKKTVTMYKWAFKPYLGNKFMQESACFYPDKETAESIITREKSVEIKRLDYTATEFEVSE